MKSQNQIIYLLLGPKGSGKSFIGTLMDRHLGIRFIRVEDWAKQVKKDRTIDNDSYLREVFAAIEKGIREEFKKKTPIVFESTGLTDYFDQMFNNLNQDFHLITIKIIADEKLCLERVKSRDQSIHINVSDDQVNHINQLVKEKDIKSDFSLFNEDKSENELVEELRNIINQK